VQPSLPSTAMKYRCSAAERADVRERFLAVVVGQLRTAQPGSDLQLAWARTAAAVGRNTGSRRTLFKDLLSGRRVINFPRVFPSGGCCRWLNQNGPGIMPDPLQENSFSERRDYFLPPKPLKRALKRSTRPAESMIRCLPV
jgi:hypothetical protein